MKMEFIETPTFTRLITKLMDDDEYSKLQLALVRRPDWGNVIAGGGGIGGGGGITVHLRRKAVTQRYHHLVGELDELGDQVDVAGMAARGSASAAPRAVSSSAPS
jgi:hypothetical protein